MKKPFKELSPYIAPLILFLLLIVAKKAFAADNGFLFEQAGDCAAETDPTEILACYFAGRVMGLVLGIASVASIAIIIYGGFTYTTSSGEPGKLKTAKNMIVGACIGLAIVVLAFSIRDFAVSRVLDGEATTITNPSNGAPSSTPALNQGTGSSANSSGTSPGQSDSTPTTEPGPPQVRQPIMISRSLAGKDLCETLKNNMRVTYSGILSLQSVRITEDSKEVNVYYKTIAGGTLFQDHWTNTPDSSYNNYFRNSASKASIQDKAPPSTDCTTGQDTTNPFPEILQTIH